MHLGEFQFSKFLQVFFPAAGVIGNGGIVK
jgi:hypothetical protein